MHIHISAPGPAGALLRLMLRVLVLIVLTLLAAPPLGAQQGAPEGTAPTEPTGGIGAAGADTDPTKPVQYSLRDEYFDLGDGGWQNLLILRADRLFLERHALVGNACGVITRVDVPLVWVDRGTGSEGGLGDVYLQALALPRLAPRWWTVLSAEARTDWQRDAATSVRSSVQLGYMISPRIGTSLTVDVYSGDRPRPEYGVRAVVFRTRF